VTIREFSKNNELSEIKYNLENNIELAFSNGNQIPIVLTGFRHNISYIQIYSSFDTSKDSKIRMPFVPQNTPILLEDGSNLGSYFFWLKENQNRLFSISDNFKRIDFSIRGEEYIEMKLEEKVLNRAVSSSHISDGTLKFLCLMAILYNPRRGSIICIDEPELGLHPDMINTLYEAIAFAGETSQVIISTHSAHLLDYFDLEQIRVFEKDENNATVVEQYSAEEFAGWKEQFYSGRLWRSGAIGGNRW
jgi:predicted ATPase